MFSMSRHLPANLAFGLQLIGHGDRGCWLLDPTSFWMALKTTFDTIMVARWLARLHKLRRWLSRSEWVVRFLGLPRSVAVDSQPGLVMIQIDGLSRREFERVIQRGRMPFLKRLLTIERHQLHTFYSGMPSTTPAVQGELFYGIPCGVPAFSFRESATGNVVWMFDPDAASRVERRLSKGGSGLLEGGSAYCDIFTGGAREAHFCASSFGWGGLLSAANPLKLAAVLFSHGWSLIRTGALMLIELGLAVIDCARGLIGRRDLWEEILLVPKRVVVVLCFVNWLLLELPSTWLEVCQ